MSSRTERRGHIEATQGLDKLAFPQSALVGSIGELARVLGDGTEVPEEACFVAGLTILGAMCGRELSLDIGFDVEPRLYAVLLGESYGAKKSTALKKTLKFFNDLESTRMPHVLQGVGSAEGLASAFTSGHKKVLLTYDELRTFVDKTKAQGSTLLPMVTSLFEQNSWDNRVKSKAQSFSVRDAELSLIGCCTLDTYEDMWTPDAIGIGLLNRLFSVVGARKEKVAWPSNPDPKSIEAIRSKVMGQIARLPRKYRICEAAEGDWEAYYQSIPNSEHSKRLDTIGLRLLGLVALTTDKDVIDSETVATVIKMLDYEFRIRQLTDPVDADDRVAALEEKIRRTLRQWGPLRKRDLRRKIHADRYGTWAFESAVKNLQSAGDLAFGDERFSLTREALEEAA